ncbi:hypothetical protein ACFXKX_23030 [Streptomyces scopuliridis]|uniref:hypothetical protein n=1 Tax=Streptomyces scopuliridis TaxID=452529 RepID=UPI00368FB4C8
MADAEAQFVRHVGVPSADICDHDVVLLEPPVDLVGDLPGVRDGVGAQREQPVFPASGADHFVVDAQ